MDALARIGRRSWREKGGDTDLYSSFPSGVLYIYKSKGGRTDDVCCELGGNMIVSGGTVPYRVDGE